MVVDLGHCLLARSLKTLCVCVLGVFRLLRVAHTHTRTDTQTHTCTLQGASSVWAEYLSLHLNQFRLIKLCYIYIQYLQPCLNYFEVDISMISV